MNERKISVSRLRDIVREELSEAHEGMPKSPHMTVVEITKAAAAGLKALESFKNKPLPTAKAKNAVGASIMALEKIFQNMLQDPMNYLDTGHPEQLVTARRDQLDDRELALRDSHVPDSIG